MRRPLYTTIRMLAGGGAGFAAAVLFVRLTAAPGVNPATSPLLKTRQDGTADAGSSSLIVLPAAGTFQNLSSKEKLACSAGLSRLSPEQRQAWLQECLQRGEPERTTLLCLLLAQWAATNPVAAAEWILAHLQGDSLQKCLDDVTRVWASRDGEALAHWADLWIRSHPGDSANRLRGAAMEALGTHDPFQQALMAEMECNRNWGWSGADAALILSTPEAIKAMGKRLKGHVAYFEDPEKLKRILAVGAGNTGIRTKNLFNQLFEQTALAWHRMDPAACDQWLGDWPESAQFAARFAIGKAEEKEKLDSAPDSASDSSTAPTRPPATGEPEAAASDPQLSGIPQRPAPAPPAAGVAADQQTSAWTRWWREDAAAAEDFLKSAAWSDELKFHARALAYSSAP